MMPVIVTHWSDDLGYPTRTIRATTNLAIHLRLTHSLLYPVKTPRFIRERGKDRICGYYLRWVVFTCHDQLEAGATTEHTFTVAGIPIGISSWCCIAESCHPLPQQFATPPIPLGPTVSPPPTSGLVLLNTVPAAFSPFDANEVTWDTLYASGPPAPPPLPVDQVPLAPGRIYHVTARVTYQALVDGTVEVVLAEFLETTIDRVPVHPISAGAIETHVLSGDTITLIPHNVELFIGAFGDTVIRSICDPASPNFIQIEE